MSQRFYPVIGGTETYLLNIAKYCASFFKIKVITSNLRNFPENLFEKAHFLPNNYEKVVNNIEIFRSKTVNNLFFKSILFFNQALIKKIEMEYDKKINPQLYSKKKTLNINQEVVNEVSKFFLLQRNFTHPYSSQIYYILKKINTKEKISLIHTSPNYIPSNIQAFRYSKKNKIPLICTPLHHINPYANYIFYPSLQYFLKNTEAIVALTNIEKNYYVNRYSIDAEKIYIIPPGIEPKEYENPDIEAFKIKYKISKENFLLFYLGRRVYEKGFYQCILALNILIKKYKIVKLMIAGPMTHYYKLIFNKIPNYLKEHIIDLGIIDDNTKSDALASCNVFLLPSLSDAFGIVYLEAWMFKKPIIGALEGNVAGLIDNDLNGFLIPFKNIKEFAAKIELLINDKNKCAILGRNGYNKLIQQFTLENTNKKMLNLYKNFVP